MKDIINKEDVTTLVEKFYQQLLQHESFKDIFNDVENFSWDTHIPVMVSFWENILFSTNQYQGNPMVKHIHLHKRSPLSPELFAQWLSIWKATIAANFEGSNATTAAKRAEQIAAVMEYKVLGSGL